MCLGTVPVVGYKNSAKRCRLIADKVGVLVKVIQLIDVLRIVSIEEASYRGNLGED